MGNRTPLYTQHVAAGGKMVAFAGWDMPLHYGSQIEEHHQVRRNAGMFDVSHMAVVDLRGPEVRALLRRVLANDVGRLTLPGKALYSCLLDLKGCVLDDLIVYFLAEDWFRIVFNAATRAKDLDWMKTWVFQYEVTMQERTDRAMLAVQGPEAREKVLALLPEGLSAAALALVPFQGVMGDNDWLVARTGYTGEDGFELIIPSADAPVLWDSLRAAGVAPCGLGARDTLRLEAGMNLYGNDMDETTTPLESGLTWTVSFAPTDRYFIGRPALEAQQNEGISHKLVGLLLLERGGVLRHGQAVQIPEIGNGVITSGGFSPTLGQSIAFARVPAATTVGTDCAVEIRGHWLSARVVKLPFVRFGQSQIV